MRCWRTMNFLTYIHCYVLLSLVVFIEESGASDCTFSKQKKDDTFKRNNKLLSRVKGLSFSFADPANDYTYELSFCKTLSDAKPDQQNVGVLQREVKGTRVFTVGNFNQATLFGGSTWLMLEYLGGTNYRHHCQNETRRALIYIICDDTAPNDSKPIVVEENRDKDDSCYYLFEYSTKAICEEKTSSSSGLSTGSIVIIVLLCLVVLYLLIGVVYKRLALGAKGMEQIPNYEFWQDFGNLQADGCNLVCRSGGGHEKKSYKGIGDDQLQDEDDRDDNLLPM